MFAQKSKPSVCVQIYELSLDDTASGWSRSSVELAEDQRQIDWVIGVHGKDMYIFGSDRDSYYKFDVEADTITEVATGIFIEVFLNFDIT